MKKFKKLGYIVYGILIFIVLLYLTFPFDQLKTRIFRTVRSQTGLELEAEKARPLIIGGLGLKFSNVSIGGSLPGFQDSISPPMKVDQLWLGISPFSLLFMHPKVKGGTDLFGGSIFVAATFDDMFKNPPSRIRISIDDIELDQLLPSKKFGINFKGDLSFAGDLEGDFSNPASLSGEVNGEVENFHIDKTTYEGFIVPELSLKKGIFRGSLLKGELKLEVFEFGSPSEDLHVLFEGKIRLGRRLQFSQADLVMKMKFSPRVQQDLKAITPLIQPALKPDGYYAFLIKGRLGGGLPLPVPLP